VLAVAQQAGTVSSQAGSTQQPNAPPAQPTRPEDLCAIEGQAVNALTGEPLKKAQITMNNLGGRTNTTPGAVTDAGGRFVIEKIDPGRYNISADRNGFVRFQYGARGPGRPGTPLTLSPGQHTRDLVFRLVPQSEPAEIPVVEHLYRWSAWDIATSSVPYTKTDAQTIEFHVSLQPDEEKTITYIAHYTW